MAKNKNGNLPTQLCEKATELLKMSAMVDAHSIIPKEIKIDHKEVVFEIEGQAENTDTETFIIPFSYVSRIMFSDNDEVLCMAPDGKVPLPKYESPEAVSMCVNCPEKEGACGIQRNHIVYQVMGNLSPAAIIDVLQNNDPFTLKIPPSSFRGWDSFVSKTGRNGDPRVMFHAIEVKLKPHGSGRKKHARAEFKTVRIYSPADNDCIGVINEVAILHQQFREAWEQTLSLPVTEEKE